MLRFLSLFACSCLCLLAAPDPVAAQEAVPQPLYIGPSGKAYLDAVRYRSVDTDVGYYDPDGAVPRLETGQAPPPPPKREGGADAAPWSTSRTVIFVLATAILIGIGMLVLRGAGSFALSLQGEAQNPGRVRRAGRGGATGVAPPPADLAAILAMADRGRALVMLAQAALARTVEANGVILQASWTLRDALRHIPKTQDHAEALRSLVLAGERVLFGNRTVTEAEFETHLAAVRPLMAGGRS